MKKKLAFLLAAIMVITSMPGMTMFAASNNRISRTIATENNTLWLEEGVRAGAGDIDNQHSGREIQRWQEGATLQIDLTNNLSEGATFTVDLQNAAWYFRQSAVGGTATGPAAWGVATPGYTTIAATDSEFTVVIPEGQFDETVMAGGGSGTLPAGHGVNLGALTVTIEPNAAFAADVTLHPEVGSTETPPANPVSGQGHRYIAANAAQTALNARVNAQFVPAWADQAIWTWSIDANDDLVLTANPTAAMIGNVLIPSQISLAAATMVGGHPEFLGPGTGTPGLNWATIRGEAVNHTTDEPGHTFNFIAGQRYVVFDSGSQVMSFYNRVPGTVHYRLDVVGGTWQTRATITILNDVTGATSGNPVRINIPLVLRTTSNNDVTVRVNAGFSQITNTTHVIGTHVDGRINVTVGGVTVRHHQIDIGRLILTETRPGSIPANRWEFELVAPSGYEWYTGSMNNVILDAPLSWVATDASGQRDMQRISASPSDELLTGAIAQVSVRYRTGGRNNTEDRSRIIVNVPQNRIQPSTAGTGGVMILTGLRLIPEDYDAIQDGRDLYFNVRNTVNTVLPSTNVRIGTARDFGITLTRVADQNRTAEVPELISGRMEVTGNNDGITIGTNNVWSGEAMDDYHRAATVRFEESIQDSWWAMRNTVFTLTEGVRFLQVEIYDSRHVTGTAGDNLHRGTNQDGGNSLNPYPFYNTGRRTGSVTIDHGRMTLHGLTVTANERARFDIRTWLNVQVDFEGDIYLTLANSAFRQVADNYEAEVVIARAVSPITVETEVTDARVGFQFVTVADFDIIENVAGALLQGEYVYVTVTDQMAIDMMIAPGFSAAVTDGNVRISNIRTNTILGHATGARYRGQLQFTIERASTVASTISFTDVQVRIDRTVPFSNISNIETQGYDIHVWGPAVARNFRGLFESNLFSNNATNRMNERDFFPVGSISAQYVVIETPGEFGQNEFSNHVEVPIGQSHVYINGDRTELPVATWICPTSNSAMVPIRFISYALGLDEGAVRWDPETSTVTVDAGVRIVQFQTGNSFYVVNGVPIRMVNVAGEPVEMQIRNERSFVPFRALGEAFNIPVSWDAATSTAIYNAPTHF